MKRNPIQLFFMAAFLFPLFAQAENRPWLEEEPELHEGATVEAVIEVLGEPVGSLGSEAFKIYHFDRGEVVFRDGELVSYSLVSEEEARRRRKEAEEQREQQRLAREREKAERLARGMAIKEERLASPAFAQLSPSARLRFWQAFQRRYPEIDVSLYITAATAEVREEERERRIAMERERRLAEAEARVAAAEERARRAEEELRRRQEPIVIVEDRVHHPRDHHRRGHGHHRRDRDRDRADRRGRDPEPPEAPTNARPERRESVVTTPPTEAYPFAPRNDTSSAYPFPGKRD